MEFSTNRPDRLAKERLEFGIRQLAGRHLELGVLGRAEPADMPVDRQIVRQVNEHAFRLFVAEEPTVGLRLQRVAADHPVHALGTFADPDIAAPADRGVWLDRRNLVLLLSRIAAQMEVDLAEIETGVGQIKGRIELDEIGELQPQLLDIPGASSASRLRRRRSERSLCSGMPVTTIAGTSGISSLRAA